MLQHFLIPFHFLFGTFLLSQESDSVNVNLLQFIRHLALFKLVEEFTIVCWLFKLILPYKCSAANGSFSCRTMTVAMRPAMPWSVCANANNFTVPPSYFGFIRDHIPITEMGPVVPGNEQLRVGLKNSNLKQELPRTDDKEPPRFALGPH